MAHYVRNGDEEWRILLPFKMNIASYRGMVNRVNIQFSRCRFIVPGSIGNRVLKCGLAILIVTGGISDVQTIKGQGAYGRLPYRRY